MGDIHKNYVLYRHAYEEDSETVSEYHCSINRQVCVAHFGVSEALQCTYSIKPMALS